MKCLLFVWTTVSDCRKHTGPPEARNHLRKSHFIMSHVTKYSMILGVIQQPWPGVSPTRHFEGGESPGDEVEFGGHFFNFLSNRSWRMAELHCYCSVTRECVFMPLDREDYVIRRHYTTFSNTVMHDRHAIFSREVVSPENLFRTVTQALRNGLEPFERSGDCYAYIMQFSCDIGWFPYRRHGPFSTNTIRIVSKYCLCQYCFQHCPSEVINIYPWT